MRFFKPIQVLNVCFFAADVWAVFGFVMPDLTIFSDLKLGPPEYAALTAFFTCCLIVINWNLIRAITPAGRFYNLQDEIRDLYGLMGNSPPAEFRGESLEKAIRLSMKLNKLGITKPDVMSEPAEWYGILPVLAAFAENRQLDDAIEISNRFEKELEREEAQP